MGACLEAASVTAFTVRKKEFGDVSAVEYGEQTKGKSWRQLGCDVYPHEHNASTLSHHEWRCRMAQSPVGDALLNAAIASLTAAGSTVAQLDINCVLEMECMWAFEGQPDGLDLSRLDTLLFHPEMAGMSEHLEWEIDQFGLRRTYKIRAPLKLHPNHVDTRCGNAILALLKPGKAALKHLEILPEFTNGWPLSWPVLYPDRFADEVIVLPALERFRTSAELHLRNFKEFITGAEKLTQLELELQLPSFWKVVRSLAGYPSPSFSYTAGVSRDTDRRYSGVEYVASYGRRQ
ncbi:hypothetical protein K458DRAFT_48374 [Lentithecium fluviatile CBS 122367]|uniref:Uncharacterized protein n=1 Tax=Lentithecium fluviatile CBS 122367 TaxID=1168545 RepID=A0A6G1IXG1_9PLEO|nr:hypothetical protein K458DRAFT_48374 [Lentithecium fluviatile CBS 122367]